MSVEWSLFPLSCILLSVTAPAWCANSAPADPVRDHTTILKVAGEYAVDFAFDETVLLQPGYERAPAMRSAADEAVIVIEDTPTKVVLQHLLVDAKTGHVTKHWREDWVYQAVQRFEFTADQTWTVRTLSPQETTGTWTQCVYEVSDAPRYCGTGRWVYTGTVATWTSDDSWRPLPRREYTRRSDYNALRVINQHTITPTGWTHEQFNTKVLRKPDGTQTEIAREFGFDDYHRDSLVDFTPAYTYWKATSKFWAKVRDHWAGVLGQPPGVHLKTKLDGMDMIMPLFQQADALTKGQQVDEKIIDKVFAEWVEPAKAQSLRRS